MDMELLQKALFNLPRLQNSAESGNRSVEKLGQLYSSVHHHAQQSAASNPSLPPPAADSSPNHSSNAPPGSGSHPFPPHSNTSPHSSVEAVSPNIVFDVASLVLYGTHAIPVRLKILLDRLFSVLSPDEVSQILKGYGWTMEDYQRGYILKDPRGAPLERWQMCSKEEEPLVLQQFLRFGETRPITQQLILQEISEKSNEEQRARTEIKKLIERNSLAAAAAAAALAQQQKHHHHHHQQQQQQHLQHQGPNTPLRSSPSPLERSSPIRHSSPGRRTPSIMGSPPGSLLSPKGPSPPTSSCSNGGPSPLHPSHPTPNSNVPTSPLNKLQSMQPFDYRNKDRKTPEIPSSMRIPPTSMAAAAAAGLAAVGGLPAMLPNVSHSLASYHNSITNIAKAQQEFSRTNPNKDHHENSSSNASSNASGCNNILNLAPSLQTKKEPPSFNLPPRSSSESGKNSPSSVRDEENGIGLISQEIRKKMRDNIGISYVNPATGKKRVQCNVCLKTFCDKGALKIHFSAVHLREMHKCSVEGCNMMFSSRRSRNRHSANPNPKLHTPHLRRKISPHDGRTHQGPSIIPYHAAALASSSPGGKGGNGPNISAPPPPPPPPPPGFPHPGLMPPGFNPQAFAAAAAANPGLIPPELLHRQQMELQRLHELKLNSMYSPHRGGSSNFSLFKNGDEDGADVKRIRLSDSENEGEIKETSSSHHETSSLPVSGSMGRALPLNSSSNNNIGSISSNNAGQTGGSHGGRKRKSQNPTRIKVNSDGDGDEDFSSDDDDEGFENPMDDDDDELGDTDDDDHRNNPGNNANSNNNSNSNNNNNSSTTTNGGARSPRDSPNKTEVESGGEGKTAAVSEGMESEDNNNSKVGSIKVLSDEKLLLKGGRSGSSGALEEDEEMDEVLSGGAVEEEDDQIPLDTENPKRCVECSEEFDNHFLLKTHFTSVHLKLLHKCTIEGCNASFPSKRSRDRHSANHNLHRKLLSTDTNGFQNEVMARLYGDGKSPAAALGGLFFGMPHPFFGNGPFFRPPLIPPPHPPQVSSASLPCSPGTPNNNNNNGNGKSLLSDTIGSNLSSSSSS